MLRYIIGSMLRFAPLGVSASVFAGNPSCIEMPSLLNIFYRKCVRCNVSVCLPSRRSAIRHCITCVVTVDELMTVVTSGACVKVTGVILILDVKNSRSLENKVVKRATQRAFDSLLSKRQQNESDFVLPLLSTPSSLFWFSCLKSPHCVPGHK